MCYTHFFPRKVNGFFCLIKKEKKIFFLIFWVRGVFVAVRGLSLVAASRNHSLVAMLGLLIVVASLVAEHGF